MKLAVCCMLSATGAIAQEPPQIAYLHPAGMQRGTTVKMTIGGRNLETVQACHFAAAGLSAVILERHRPLTARERNLAREELAQLQNKAGDGTLSATERNRVATLRQQLAESRRELSPQLAETVVLRLSADQDAPLGKGDLRLRGAGGLSNPLRFVVGTLPEHLEAETAAGAAAEAVAAPVVVNGRLLATDVDRFRVRAAAGTRLVADLEARALLPFLADAVPGWFQATLTVRSPDGSELAFVDDRGPEPDPLLSFVAPVDGDYVVEVQDALARGREDFVYRLTLGELPAVTSVFPLGARTGTRTRLHLSGFNLVDSAVELTPGGDSDLSAAVPGSAAITLATDSLPEILESSLADRRVPLALPILVNGTIAAPCEADTYAFRGRAATKFVAEVTARRLGSPLDARLVLLDAQAKVVAVADDAPWLLRNTMTDAADACLECTLPRDGVYRLRLEDARQKGGPTSHYRLRIGPPRPDFDLRLTPSSLNVVSGGSADFTVHAARREGLTGDIQLALVDPPPGFRLDGAVVPDGVDRITLTLTAPAVAPGTVHRLQLQGTVKSGSRSMIRRAQPADDRTQAFAYHHLVHASEWACCVLPPLRRTLPGLRPVDNPLHVRRRGITEVVVADGLRPDAARNLAFTLREPPAGLSLGAATVRGGKLVLELLTDGNEALRGSRGNLIFAVTLAATPAAGQGKAKRQAAPRVLATLPAIQFAVEAK